MKTATVLASVMLCALGHLAAAPATYYPATRVARWQEDLDFFARELPARHKDFFRLMPQARFKREVAELKRAVSQLSDAEIILQLSRMVASLGVAHTSVSFGSALHSYPLQMQWFSDGLAVVATAPEYQQALGSRVLWIGSKTPAQVEAAVAPYIARENDAHLHNKSPGYMKIVELMRHEQIADPSGRLRLTCAKAGGEEFTLEIAPERSAKTRQGLMKAADALHIPEEFCRKHPTAFYWYEYLPATQTLYIQYNKCREEPGNPFVSFARNLFAFADAHPVQSVIVDLRFNGGGSNAVIKPLVAGLKSRPALRAKGHLYALIGWSTFSAAMNDALKLHNDLGAILVGEPAGNKPNHYGEQESFRLPNSKLMVHYSTKYIHQIRDADPSTLAPDIFVPYSLHDFLAGRDPVLEAVLHHPLHSPAVPAPQPVETPTVQPRAATPAPVAENRVAAAGFQPLFNGRDLTGWTPMLTTGLYNDVHRPTTGGWVVQNGELLCTTHVDGWLRSDQQYGDFVLQLDFKLQPEGHSGVYIRSSNSGHLSRMGMEIQIIDPHYRRAANLTAKQLSGAIFGVVGPGHPPLRPIGQWNSMEIRCAGDNVEVMLNGTRTASANMHQYPELRDRPRSGYIGLSNWQGEARGTAFRNIRIEEHSAK